jgi:hypothetical protein
VAAVVREIAAVPEIRSGNGHDAVHRICSVPPAGRGQSGRPRSIRTKP